MKETIWEGVYSNFQDVPEIGPGFRGGKWIENSLKKIYALREIAEKENIIPEVTRYRESILPVVASMAYNEKGEIKILDFGGSLGFTYYQVIQSLPSAENFEFHIVENEAVCEAGREFFKQNEKIIFYSDLPNSNKRFDIIHMSSSIHYVEKWQDIIARMRLYQPRYILFTDLLAGNIPTYASIQNYYGSKIPVWFLNVDEVIKTMESQQFKIIFKATYISKILGLEQPFPQGNFNKKYRLRHSCILLFGNEVHN